MRSFKLKLIPELGLIHGASHKQVDQTVLPTRVLHAQGALSLQYVLHDLALAVVAHGAFLAGELDQTLYAHLLRILEQVKQKGVVVEEGAGVVRVLLYLFLVRPIAPHFHAIRLVFQFGVFSEHQLVKGRVELFQLGFNFGFVEVEVLRLAILSWYTQLNSKFKAGLLSGACCLRTRTYRSRCTPCTSWRDRPGSSRPPRAGRRCTLTLR